MKILKLGTRRSLLAWAQSSWVAHQIEKVNPGIKIQLVGIETQGDRIQDVPLWAINGKEFFVAEIDRALVSKEVDLTVHSMKDLSLERPKEFCLAAIPKRENPRDVVLFGPKASEHLEKGVPLKIGSSSPRRVENVPDFLKKALPRKEKSPFIQMTEIRGNVNTRLARVHLKEDDPKYLDGVVLAFAGLIRLWKDEKGQASLKDLLNNVRWMVLPLSECPAAPAQGALAIECRADDPETLNAIRKIHDFESEELINLERQILKDWGGGCHQRFGATAQKLPEFKAPLLFIRGIHPQGQFVDELRWQVPYLANQTREPYFDGSKNKLAPGQSEFLSLPVEEIFTKKEANQACFVAHSNAVNSGELVKHLSQHRIWTSGVNSWFKLAKKGLWVEGCGEGFGFKHSKTSLSEPVLQLPPLSSWAVLTHQSAVSGWRGEPVNKVVATYKLEAFTNSEVDPAQQSEVRKQLKQAQIVYWSSTSQFEQLHCWTKENAVHCSGPGKTASYIRSQNKEVLVFPSAEEWRKWVKMQA